MVYTLKTNRHPIATARKMDVGLDEMGVRGGKTREEEGQWGEPCRVKVVIKRQ